MVFNGTFSTNRLHRATSVYLSIAVLTAIFPGGPGLAGTRMSPFPSLLELRMARLVAPVVTIDGGGGDNWNYKMCITPVRMWCHHQQTNTQIFTGWMPFLSPNQQCQSTSWHERMNYIFCRSRGKTHSNMKKAFREMQTLRMRWL